MNTNKKKTHKFNVIDLLLIIIILGAIAVLFYMIVGNKFIKSKNDVTILYKIEIPLLRNELIPEVSQIKNGEKFIDSVRSYNLGNIYDIKFEDAYMNSENAMKGIVELKPYPEYSKMTITVKSDCEKNEKNYMINGKILMVGVRVDFRTSHLINYGFCTDIIELTDTADENTTSDITTEQLTSGNIQ